MRMTNGMRARDAAPLMRRIFMPCSCTFAFAQPHTFPPQGWVLCPAFGSRRWSLGIGTGARGSRGNRECKKRVQLMLRGVCVHDAAPLM